MTDTTYAFGKKIKRSLVEDKTELVEKIVARANDESSRSVGERTAVKRYVKYINSMTDEEFAHYYSPEDSVYFENEPDARAKTKKTNKPSEMTNNLDDIEVKLVKMKDQNFDPKLFIPIKSGTYIDEIISNKGGIMPATNTIVLGDPGIGKTTVLLDLLSHINKTNPDKKCLFISGEMNSIDLAEYMERLPLADELDIFFTMDYESNCHLALMKVLQQGWDIVLIDSFDEVKESLNEDLGLSGTKAEKWFIDLMVDHNLAKNLLNKHTAFMAIQQVTKGGKFVGSNKLKHNTTAMLEMRYDKSTGNPKMYYTKNRRGNTNIDLFFDITSNGIEYDKLRYSRELDFLNKSKMEERSAEEEQEEFASIFGIQQDENGEWIDTEKKIEEAEEVAAQ